MLHDSETFEVQGLTFRFNSEDDHDAGRPWDREDGHGEVSDWRSYGNQYPHKAPGERVLCTDRRSCRTYDMAETIRIAKRDGWGLDADAIAQLSHRLGRVPTAKQIRAEAVELDFQRLRRWCTDQWNYIGVTVTLMVLDADGDPVEYDGPLRAKFMDALWGVESDSPEYIEETAHELAEGIAAIYLHERAEALAWAERDVATVA